MSLQQNGERVQVPEMLSTSRPSGDPSDTLMERVTRTVLDRAPCEVVLNKQPAR